MNVKTISIDDLKPYAHNPKTHPAEQVERIARSIARVLLGRLRATKSSRRSHGVAQ